MSRYAYVNGCFQRHNSASVSIEDRGFQFADGVYEVVGVHNGKLFDLDDHFIRLERSLSELQIPMPMSRKALAILFERVRRKNLIDNGAVYLQVTRGVAPRNHLFPLNCRPSVILTALRREAYDKSKVLQGTRVITLPDTRWKRCDIKTISLLPNVLSKQEAYNQGAAEAWLIDDEGMVTEGTSSNAWIVTSEGELITRYLSNEILGGITRKALLKIAGTGKLKITERAFSKEDAYKAKEAFLTSTGIFVRPVVQIDDHQIGEGQAGKLTRELLDWYEKYLNHGMDGL